MSLVAVVEGVLHYFLGSMVPEAEAQAREFGLAATRCEMRNLPVPYPKGQPVSTSNDNAEPE